MLGYAVYVIPATGIEKETFFTTKNLTFFALWRDLKILETFHRSTFPSFRQALSTKAKLQTPSFFLNGDRVRSRSAWSAVLVIFNSLYGFFTWLALSNTVWFKTRICLQTVKGILRNLKQLKSINELGD